MSDPRKHTHPGDGTVPGLHGEPIPTPVLGCPACATVDSIAGGPPAAKLEDLRGLLEEVHRPDVHELRVTRAFADKLKARATIPAPPGVNSVWGVPVVIDETLPAEPGYKSVMWWEVARG